MKEIRRWLLSLLFPNRCYLCGGVIGWRDRLCAACYDKVPYILPPVCPACGRSKSECSCRGHKRLFERCVSPLYYTDHSKLAIYNLKTYGYHGTVDALANEMAEVIRREYGGIPFDAVVPVPLHKVDMSRRGFNQAELLARALSSYIRVPMKPMLTKLYATKPQKSLTLQQRNGNLLGAFDVTDSDSAQDAVLLLVDDIITTGSTLDECAKMLKLYGAKEVYAVTAAAAMLKEDNH